MSAPYRAVEDRPSRIRWIALIVFVTGLVAYAQDTIKVNVETVQVYATVTDNKGRFVTDLERQDFKVLEEGKEQHVDSFLSDDSPLSIGILFDANGPMGDSWNVAKASALEFLRAGNLANQYFVIEFNDKPKLTLDYTSDPDDLKNHVPEMNKSRDDGAVDAIEMGLEKLKQAANPRKVLLVFSSGGHLQSKHHAAEVRELGRKLDVQIYGVTMVETDFHGELNSLDSGRTLIEDTGGETFIPDTGKDFITTCRKIAVGLRNQYIMGYQSTNPAHDGKYRHLDIQVVLEGAPHLNVQTRNGYYAGTGR